MIYFAQRSSDQLIRIGTALDVKRRMVTLGKGHGNVTVLASIEGRFVEESFIHHCFAPTRVEGDWFAPSEAMDQTVREANRYGFLWWLPLGEILRGGCARERAIAEFGTLAGALEPLGYSPSATVVDVFSGSSRSAAGPARLAFYLAFRRHRLPGFITGMHGDKPCFHCQSHRYGAVFHESARAAA